MELFCFASKNVENIRRGLAAGMWAVSTARESVMRTRNTKAEKHFREGSRGLLYCTETHSFTTPFIATSRADPDAVIINIWPEPWVLPFSIKPLGDLSKQLKGELAKHLWPMLKNCGHGGVTAALNITGTTVFTPKRIAETDWALVVQHLGYDQISN